MTIEELINKSILEVPVRDNMDGTYSFARIQNSPKWTKAETLCNSQGWAYHKYIIVSCDVCGTACVKPIQSLTRCGEDMKIRCSPKCNNMKAFTYEEIKKGLHKKKMPKGKYLAYNGVDLAVRYKDKYAYYKDYGDNMKFWKMYDGKQSQSYLWLKVNCVECKSPYYIFKCKNSTKPGCSQQCRQKIAYKNNKRKNVNSYKNPSVYQMNYPTFLDENGKRKRCHVHSMELHLGRPMRKGEVIHHINMLKDEYDISNLYLCDISSHQVAHGTMNDLVHILMNKGIVGFSKDKGEYYLVNQQPT